MKTVALIVIALLLGAAVMPALTYERIPSQQQWIAATSAGLAGILMGVVFAPFSLPFNVVIGLGFSFSLMLMVYLATLPDRMGNRE